MKKQIRNKIESLKTGWYIWLFPLFALLISGWLLFDYYKQQGPTIKIVFDDSGGIQPAKTTVRFRGVAIGTVKDVYISEDQKNVVAEVVLRRDAKRFAVDGSKFSLITPKVGLSGISGLETIFQGTYIEVLPGHPDGKEKVVFKAQSAAGATDTLDDSSAYLIESSNVESFNPGDSITYRGMKIGSITKMYLSKDALQIQMQVNIENRYTRLIRTNTVFWRKVGVQAKLGLFNSEIKVNSLDSIMNGGIEIGTPTPAGPMAKALQKFPLSATAPKNVLEWKTVLE